LIHIFGLFSAQNLFPFVLWRGDVADKPCHNSLHNGKHVITLTPYSVAELYERCDDV